jgi:hypothetical protein
VSTALATAALLLAAVAPPAQDRPRAPVDQNAPQTRPRTNWPCTGKERSFDPSYARLSEGTGGHLFLSDPSELGAVTQLAVGDMRHKESVVRVTGRLAGALTVNVPVDSTIDSLFVAVTVQCFQDAQLLGPAGEAIRPEDAPGGEDHWYRAGRIAVVPKPKPGAWLLQLAGTGFYSVAVQASSPLAIGGTTFEHGLPRPGTQTASVSVSGDVRMPTVNVITAMGEPLNPWPLEPSASNPGRLEGTITLDRDRTFRVMVLGTDAAGLVVQRVDPRLHDPSLRAQ